MWLGMDNAGRFDLYYKELTKRTEKNIDVLCHRLQRSDDKFRFCHFEHETQLEQLRDMIKSELSEPYTIFTYRFFVYERPELCILAYYGDDLIGVIIGRVNLRNPDGDEGLGVAAPHTANSSGIDNIPRDEGVDVDAVSLLHTHVPLSGYIAMIAVKREYRRKNIGTILVLKEVQQCLRLQCDEVYLETEVSNVNALRLYQKLGFSRHLRLKKYYQNGNDAYRLKLWLRLPVGIPATIEWRRKRDVDNDADESLSHLLQHILRDSGATGANSSTGAFRTVINAGGHETAGETVNIAGAKLSNRIHAKEHEYQPAVQPSKIELDRAKYILPNNLLDLLKPASW